MVLCVGGLGLGGGRGQQRDPGSRRWRGQILRGPRAGVLYMHIHRCCVCCVCCRNDVVIRG